jgi:hemerythrin
VKLESGRKEGVAAGDRRPLTSRLVWQEAQHQRLFELLDDLAGEADLARVLSDLHRYAEEHFVIEEAYMEAIAFPEAAAHRRAHDKFRAQLAELSAADVGDDDTREMSAMFLREWLTRHIYGTDKALEAFILASNVK